MAKISIKTREEIWKLYFEKFYSIEELVQYFKNKFTYQEIKFEIMRKYDKYEKKGDFYGK